VLGKMRRNGKTGTTVTLACGTCGIIQPGATSFLSVVTKPPTSHGPDFAAKLPYGNNSGGVDPRCSPQIRGSSLTMYVTDLAVSNVENLQIRFRIIYTDTSMSERRKSTSF
jgi:hypothetical protein